MTSLIAWAGMDAHGQTSLYFATDSRISWSKLPPYWDIGRKVFACTKEPDIFAFTGDALFSVTVISRLCSLIDDDLVLETVRSSLTTRCTWVSDCIKDAHEKYPKNRLTPYTIFYGTRIGSGTKPNSLLRRKAKNRPNFDPHLGSWFGCITATWDGADSKMGFLAVPQNRSQYIAADGTGKYWIDEHQTKMQDDPQYRTSRIIFRAFCNSLNGAKDAQTGGPPQLVGLYRAGPAKSIGIATKNGVSYLGITGQFASPNGDWRNEDFERVDSSGNLLPKAKKHRFE